MREETPSLREQQPRAVREAPTASRDWALLVGAISIGVGAVLAVSGAFGMDVAPLWVRLAYWIPTMLAGAVIGTFITNNLVGMTRWAGSPIAAWALIFIAVSVPMCMIVAIGNSLAFGMAFSVLSVASTAPSVLLISALMTGIFLGLNQVPRETHAAAAMERQGGEPRFFARLPPHLKGARIYAVEADDHYLKVHTSRGMEMILMRLGDAITELDGVEGAQVHRSWWVARAAVEDATRDDGRATLQLVGGLSAPVSRTYARALREAGWF